MSHQPSRYATLGAPSVSPVSVEPLQHCRLALTSPALLAEFGLTEADWQTLPYHAAVLGKPTAELSPVATVYAGHQFGHYVPRLGDGRALLLGEWQPETTPDVWEIQLKGAGKTPYSRMGDGRAVLRSSLREFLCSEAMAALGIPTTRALALYTSTEPVYRERAERGAIVVRAAESFLRFGHLEYCYYTGQDEQLKRLIDFMLANYFPQFDATEAGIAAWLDEVVIRTAKLMAQWQAVGFCHGVMNTDNMSVLGLTLDYGPFGFLDTFNPGHICNHSDHDGRYAYNQQPTIGHWNCAALAQSLARLLPIERIRESLALYPATYGNTYRGLMRQKLGLVNNHADDGTLLQDLLELLYKNKVDYTQFFRQWSHAPLDEAQAALAKHFAETPEAWSVWVTQFRTRVTEDPASDWPTTKRQQTLLAINPALVLRNHHAQTAINAAEADDFTVASELLTALLQPFSPAADASPFAMPPAPNTPPLIISCSS